MGFRSVSRCKIFMGFNLDDLIKSHKIPFYVIPAKAGIQSFQKVADHLDSGFTGVTDY